MEIENEEVSLLPHAHYHRTAVTDLLASGPRSVLVQPVWPVPTPPLPTSSSPSPSACLQRVSQELGI